MLIDDIAKTFSPNAITGEARLLMCNRSDEIGDKLTKLQIDGVLIGENNLDDIDGAWSMMECQVIIIPKRLHTGAQNSLNPGSTVDQMLTRGYNYPENWANRKDIDL